MKAKPNQAEAQLLIRKPVDLVFNAFINPEVTTNFWFTKSSGKLELNKEIEWTWEMYNFSSTVIATEIKENKTIAFDWIANQNSTKVKISFIPVNPNATFVTVIHDGFNETDEQLIDVLKDSTSGFTLVLAGLKAFLEHRIQLNLIADKFPKELTNHEKELKK